LYKQEYNLEGLCVLWAIKYRNLMNFLFGNKMNPVNKLNPTISIIYFSTLKIPGSNINFSKEANPIVRKENFAEFG